MNEKKTNWFLRIIFCLFIIFIGLFVASESGYYENKLSKNVALTKEEIKKFESDVKAGKEIDLYKYINNEYEDYSNTFTKAGDALSKIVVSFVNDGISGTLKVIRTLFM